ncbi:hypothetical protein, partial [Mesorhizobium sp.]|uniref:hypothetical protein n=1 Tax=Mesorhizobium sp. TaxID=1871066 RepID=UPI00257AF873
MSDVSYLEFFAQIFVTALSIIGLVRALRDPKRLENINLDDLNIFKALSVFLLAIGGLIAPFVWITPYAWELMGLMVNNSMPFPGGILIAAGYTIFIL